MNLRKAFLVVAGVLSGLLLMIGVVSVGALRAFEDAREAVKERQASMALVNDVRAEADLLGRLVSSYVSTADPRYLIYYYDILAMREGSKPIPAGRSAAYWEQVMAGTLTYESPRSGETSALIERISRMGFDARERGLVRQIHQLTERMKQVEQIAFAATQGLYDPKRREFVSDGTPERGYANELLHSNAYLAIRAEMAVAIDGLARDVDERTARGLAGMAEILQRLIYAGFALLLATALALFLSYRYLERHLLRPLIRLHGVASALEAKSYSVRVGSLQGVEEVKLLAATVDDMAAAIEADVRKREISEEALREASAKAEVATEAKSIFLANMSHEIRTPMNAILGMAYLALKSGLPPRQHDYVSKIHGAAASLLGIINDILDFSKIEAGKVELEHQPMDIEAVVQNALFMVQQRAEERRLELLLDYRLPPGFPMLEGDALRLGQVLINLLSNAVKFTESGHVCCAVTDAGSRPEVATIRFSVSDTGIGMTADQVSKLFRDFSQADGSTTRKYGGTGLGLSISRRLVQAMGGEISVESVVNAGSRFEFCVSLPVGQERLPLPESHHCQRVLVVDAYQPARESTASLFTLIGSPQVDQAESAAEAQARLLDGWRAGEHCDLLVIDWASCGKGLPQLLASLREVGAQLPRQIVAVTAADVAQLRAEAMAAGVAELIHKPFFPADLRRLCGELKPVEKASSPPEDAGEVLAGMRILVVEDNEINQEVASELLQSWGASIEIAENGAVGLERLMARESNYFSVVLMDINMPVMGGVEATQRIRAEKRFTGLPILALTAHAVGSELLQALQMGMNGHIAKPFDPDELRDRLQAYAAKKVAIPVPAVVPKAGIDAENFAASLATIPGLDAGPLLHRFRGRIPSLIRALGRFASDAPGILAKLETALAEGDVESAQREAHTLKGLAGTFGLTGLASAAVELEATLKQGLVPDAQSVSALTEGLGGVIPALASLLDGDAAKSDQTEPAEGPKTI